MEQKKILIVEDEILAALYLKKLLCNSGYLVLPIITDGNEAIHKAIDSHPDLLIMDVLLDSGPDGIAVVEEVQKHAHIPVIYITALTDEITMARAEKTKPLCMFGKPFKEIELLHLVNNLFTA